MVDLQIHVCCFLTFIYSGKFHWEHLHCIHTHSNTHTHREAAQNQPSDLLASTAAVEGLNARSRWNFAEKSIYFNGITTISRFPCGGEGNLWSLVNFDMRDQQQTVFKVQDGWSYRSRLTVSHLIKPPLLVWTAPQQRHGLCHETRVNTVQSYYHYYYCPVSDRACITES